MRVRILSGNHTGSVEEVSQQEGESLLMTGFAELAPVEAPDPLVAAADVTVQEVACQQAGESPACPAVDSVATEPPVTPALPDVEVEIDTDEPEPEPAPVPATRRPATQRAAASDRQKRKRR